MPILLSHNALDLLCQSWPGLLAENSHMDNKQTSFKRWHQQLHEPVPLNMVPEILKISRQQVADQVKAGKLRVYSFRTHGGKVYRMVPCADLKNFGKNPLTLRGMSHAFKRLLAA